MKITSTTTRPAVPSGPMIGPSQANAGKARRRLRASTTTGCGARPSGRVGLAEVGLDVLDRLLQLLDRAALAGAAHVGDLREDVDAVARAGLRRGCPSAAPGPSRRGRARRTPASRPRARPRRGRASARARSPAAPGRTRAAPRARSARAPPAPNTGRRPPARCRRRRSTVSANSTVRSFMWPYDCRRARRARPGSQLNSHAAAA